MPQGSNNLLLKQSLHFGFKISNNQVEYETLLAGLILTANMGAENITCHKIPNWLWEWNFPSEKFLFVMLLPCSEGDIGTIQVRKSRACV